MLWSLRLLQLLHPQACAQGQRIEHRAPSPWPYCADRNVSSLPARPHLVLNVHMCPSVSMLLACDANNTSSSTSHVAFPLASWTRSPAVPPRRPLRFARRR